MTLHTLTINYLDGIKVSIECLADTAQELEDKVISIVGPSDISNYTIGICYLRICESMRDMFKCTIGSSFVGIQPITSFIPSQIYTLAD